MKKLIGSLILISIFLFGSYKTNPAVEELLMQIQNQKDALKVQVAAMQKSYSKAIILKVSLTSSSNADKKMIQSDHNLV